MALDASKGIFKKKVVEVNDTLDKEALKNVLIHKENQAKKKVNWGFNNNVSHLMIQSHILHNPLESLNANDVLEPVND